MIPLPFWPLLTATYNLERVLPYLLSLSCVPIMASFLSHLCLSLKLLARLYLTVYNVFALFRICKQNFAIFKFEERK